ncbi:MAG: hypothetical protein JW791_02370 [Nanoarchaeota archaeon]|nr:hypothetical protein [Nanoarchaeota archaeon]
MVSEGFIKVLNLVKDRLNSISIKWFIGGSVSLLLQGMNVEPNDIDVIISYNDKNKVMELFKDYGIVNNGLAKDKDRESLHVSINGVKVEFCAEFPHGCYLKRGGEVAVINGFPCLKLGAQSDAYAECSRLDKARIVDEFIKSKDL